MLQTLRESRHVLAPLAVAPLRATVDAERIYVEITGFRNVEGTGRDRSWGRFFNWLAALVRQRGAPAGRIKNCISTGRLRKLHDQSKCLHRMERNAQCGLLRGFNASQHALAYFSSNGNNRSRLFVRHGFLLTQNGNTRRHSTIHLRGTLSNRASNYTSSCNKEPDGYRCERNNHIRTQEIYGYGLYTNGHIHSSSGSACRYSASLLRMGSKSGLGRGFGIGRLTWPGGLGCGFGSGFTGPFAKIFLLESVGAARMEKMGGLGNRLSRMGGVA